MNIVLLISICIAVIMCCIFFIQLFSPIKKWEGDGNLYKNLHSVPRGTTEADGLIEKKDLKKYERQSYLVLNFLLSFSFMYHILTENPQGIERKIMTLLVLVFLALTLKGWRALQIVDAIKKHYDI